MKYEKHAKKFHVLVVYYIKEPPFIGHLRVSLK